MIQGQGRLLSATNTTLGRPSLRNHDCFGRRCAPPENSLVGMAIADEVGRLQTDAA
jgi:hypothetical protein